MHIHRQVNSLKMLQFECSATTVPTVFQAMSRMSFTMSKTPENHVIKTSQAPQIAGEM